MDDDNTFALELQQQEKRYLAECVNITSYWLEKHPETFPHSTPNHETDNDPFTLEREIMWTLSAAFGVCEERLPRAYRQEGTIYLALKKQADELVSASWLKYDLTDAISITPDFARELYEATGIMGAQIENEKVRKNLAHVVMEYLFECGFNVKNRYTTFDATPRKVIFEWSPRHL